MLFPHVKPPLGVPIYEQDPSLVRCWLMNEGSGNTVADLSGNFYAGTHTAGTWSGGQYGSAILLAGNAIVTTNAKIPAIAISSDWTLIFECMFPTSTDSQNRRLFQQMRSSNDRFNVEIISSSVPRMAVVHYSGSTVGARSTLEVYPDIWYHFAIVGHSDNTYQIFRDGVEDTTGTPASVPSYEDANFRFGQAAPFGGFDGILDYCVVFSRALSASEIASLYATPFAMFERPTPELWVEAGGEPPAGNPQFITIIMSTLPLWLVVGLAISMGYNVSVKRKAA